jgi:RimJ/RimL family protein N-acetyltransferase
MNWTLSSNLDDFLAAAGGFLRSRPAANTIQLGILETLHARGARAFGDPPPIFGWWRPAAGQVIAAIVQTPPYPILLTALPGYSAALLAEGLVACGRRLPGVNAAQGDATAFAAAWTRLTAASAHEVLRSRLYQLGPLQPPVPVPPGAARVAASADRGLLETWLGAFHREIDEQREPVRATVEDRLSFGGLTLWEVEGTAVAMAGIGRPAAGVTRVAPVYTPPEHRRQGYGAAITAAVSQSALDAGASDVVLFTDLANPVSNSIYQRIGYRPLEDRVVLEFDP